MALRVTPNASGDRIEGVALLGDERPVLKVRVTAVPDKGKANAAVVKLLAKAWGVPRSSLSIVAGEKDRNKTVQVAGDPADLTARLTDWFCRSATE